MGASGKHADALSVPKSWDEFFDNPNYQVSEDFMADYLPQG